MHGSRRGVCSTFTLHGDAQAMEVKEVVIVFYLLA